MDFYFLFLFDFISTIVSYNAIKKCAKKVPGTSKTPLYPVKKPMIDLINITILQHIIKSGLNKCLINISYIGKLNYIKHLIA